MKVALILDALDKLKEDDLVIILDGYDTAIQTLEHISDKYKQYGRSIIFNATKHNYPEINIDSVQDRDIRGEFKYFNAGVCIGDCNSLKRFYNECKKQLEIEPTNIWNSEQYTIRQVFNKMQDIVDFDSQCILFQTMGSTKIIKKEGMFIVV